MLDVADRHRDRVDPDVIAPLAQWRQASARPAVDPDLLPVG
jgi:hypothetical protein